jgi:hypothetical protein
MRWVSEDPPKARFSTVCFGNQSGRSFQFVKEEEPIKRIGLSGGA